jgi:hypothetical protein
MGLCIRFTDDGHGVYICGRLSEREDFPSVAGVAFTTIVAAVGVSAGCVAAVYGYTVVVDGCEASVTSVLQVIRVL